MIGASGASVTLSVSAVARFTASGRAESLRAAPTATDSSVTAAGPRAQRRCRHRDRGARRGTTAGSPPLPARGPRTRPSPIPARRASARPADRSRALSHRGQSLGETRERRFGMRGIELALAWAIADATAAPLRYRFHVTSMPSKRSRRAGAPARDARYCRRLPRRSGAPNPWDLWLLRESPAISLIDRPSSGS